MSLGEKSVNMLLLLSTNMKAIDSHKNFKQLESLEWIWDCKIDYKIVIH